MMTLPTRTGDKKFECCFVHGLGDPSKESNIWAWFIWASTGDLLAVGTAPYIIDAFRLATEEAERIEQETLSQTLGASQ